MYQDHFELDEKQRKAFQELKKAHKKCINTGIFFYNNYGTLGALRADTFEQYTDEISFQRDRANKLKYILNHGQNSQNEFNLKCNEWADDTHYFKLK